MTAPGPDTPLDARRARIAQAVRAGKAVGYGCFGVAMALFAVGYLWGFTGLLSGAVVTLLLTGCIALPPAIVFGYGLRAAQRHDREETLRRRQAGGPPPT